MKHLMKRAWTKYALVALVTALIVAPAVAVASHGFTDVPDTHLFHNNIQWMKDNGVTLGCNPPANDKYCPSNTVNRGQMAAFMQRLAENKVVDAATAVTAETAADADMLDGLDSTHLIAVSGTSDSTQIDDFTASSPTELLSHALAAPADGFVHITATVTAESDNSLGDDGRLQVILRLDGADLLASDQYTFQIDTNGGVGVRGGSVTITAVVPVSAGDHTFQLMGDEVGGGSYIYNRSISTIFTTLGSSNITGAAATAGASNNN